MEYVIPFLNLAEPTTEGVTGKTVHYYNYLLCNLCKFICFQICHKVLINLMKRISTQLSQLGSSKNEAKMSIWNLVFYVAAKIVAYTSPKI